MHDADAANKLPIGGNMSLQKQGAIHHYPVCVSPSREHGQRDGQAGLQRILVVEDDPTLATLEAEVLAAHGYFVVIVDSGELAITTLQQYHPDLVVLDLELIGSLNGWDVLEVLRTYSNIPVLFTTSSTAMLRKYTRERGETRLTLDHLPKPYPMQQLLRRVQRMLAPISS